MKAKELSHWLEALSLPTAPWLKSDWESMLNLMARFLYKKLAERIEEVKKENEEVEGVSLTFQELMELAESTLGIPQFTVVCDTKQSIAENQLAIFTAFSVIKYGMAGHSEIKAFKDIVFPYRFSFDLDVDESSRFCAECNNQVFLVERSIVDGCVWHRTCMRCSLCKKQLYQGAFHGDATHLECVEHFANRILYGDPLHRPEEKASTTPYKVVTPPPRPPPPKLGRESMEKRQEQAPHEDTMTISQKIEHAANLHHDIETSMKNSPVASEKNWEMLNYPEALNPFGSDDEENTTGGFDMDFDETTKTSSNNNPFSDTDDNDGSDIEDVENPVDRVVSSFDNPSSPMSSTSDTASNPCSPKLTQRKEEKVKTEKETPSFPAVLKLENDDTISEEVAKKTGDSNGSKQRSQAPPPPKPPRFSDQQQKTEEGEEKPAIMTSSSSLALEKKYFPPIAPMVWAKSKSDKNIATLCGNSQHELGIQLWKLHCQLTQIETTGKRLESQILRGIQNGTLEWKKSKLVDEYVATVEKKCEALRIESILVRKYMDLFIGVSHDELEKQMKALPDEAKENNDSKRADLTELLVQLMHMKNDLLVVESAASSSISQDACKAVKKSDTSSLLKKGVKQTLRSLKKKKT